MLRNLKIAIYMKLTMAFGGELWDNQNLEELWEIWNLAEPGAACLGEPLGAISVAWSLYLSKNPLKRRLVKERQRFHRFVFYLSSCQNFNIFTILHLLLEYRHEAKPSIL